MKKSQSFFPSLLFAALLVLCACFAHAQVSVAIAPQPFLRFTNATGAPLAGGFLYTYQAGTTTFQNTYVDSQGTVQNPDPIPLDATGAPSNGSVQTMVWLANLAYKFCLYDSNLVPQGCKDNLTGYLGLLNLANTWTFQQTFSLAILDTLTDNQMIFGAPGNQTTLDFPPSTGNVTLHMPNVPDTVVARQTTDTLSNKTLINPLFNTSGCGIVNGPGTYICVANANPVGTTIGTLTKLINAPSQATIAAITDTNGIQGITVAGAGNTGTATIQQSGQAPCIFDGPTVAGDYVQRSPTVAGDCNDAGAAGVPSGQSIGTVLTTNGTGGTYQMDLFGPGIQGGKVQTVTSTGSGSNASAATTAFQPIPAPSQYIFPANALNTAGKAFRVTANVQLVRGGGATTAGIFWANGPSSALAVNNTAAATFGSSASTIQFSATWTCVTVTTGVSGVISCMQVATSDTATTFFLASTQGNGVNLTVPFYVGMGCTFGAASVLNQCGNNNFLVEQLN